MKRKLIIVTTVIFLFTAIPYSASYTANLAKYPVQVNGSQINGALNVNGTTYLPLKTVGQAFGTDVNWTGQSVEISTVDVDKLKEACVMIVCKSSSAWSQGSGVYIDYDTVLTAYHVVEGMTDIKIDGTSFKIADYNKQYDIATLTADVSVKPVKIGDSDEITTNEPAFMIGYPGGGGINVINAKITHGGPPYMSLSQRAEKGMSGGPIFNSKGELIGIINGSSTGVEMSTGTTINIIREML